MYKVIIADDEPMARMALVNLINWNDIGCVLVYEAVDGNDLIKSVKKYAPDIVISDIKMPGMDGIEIGKYIYENKLHTKLILLTAYADFSYAKSAIKYDVVEYVTKTGSVDNIIKAIRKAKKILEKESIVDIKMSKLSFLKSVIDSSIYEEDKIKLHANELNLTLNEYIVVPVVFSFNGYENTKKESDMCKSITNFFSLVFKEYDNYIINFSKESFVIIVHNLDSNYIARTRKMCMEVLKTVTGFMHGKINIGVSQKANDINKLALLYKQATEALSQSFLSEDNNVYFYEKEIKQNDYAVIKQNDKLLDALSHSIQKGNTNNALKTLEDILTLQKNNNFFESQIKSSGFLIESKCSSFLSEYDVTLQHIIKLSTDIYTLIVKSKYFNEYAHLLRIIVKETSDYIDNYIKNTNVIILECNRYIEENYSSNTTLNKIAQIINVNSSYLSRLYKEKTGNTILNTINNMRIEKAKEYLEKTDMKIYEIADAIGIEDPTYFSHFFRRYTSYSPKEYKKHINEKNH